MAYIFVIYCDFLFVLLAVKTSGNSHICTEDGCSHAVFHEDVHVLCLQCCSCSEDCYCDICCNWSPDATIKLACEMAGDHILWNISVKPHGIQAILAFLNFHDSLDIKVMNAS